MGVLNRNFFVDLWCYIIVQSLLVSLAEWFYHILSTVLMLFFVNQHFGFSLRFARLQQSPILQKIKLYLDLSDSIWSSKPLKYFIFGRCFVHSAIWYKVWKFNSSEITHEIIFLLVIIPTFMRIESINF